MKENVVIDEAGRIEIPRAMRDDLRLQPGDVINMELRDGELLLRSAREFAALSQEQGVWVLTTAEPLPASPAELLEEDRKQQETKSIEGD
jgi:AbrB family looped-hinge helix DNA binding protein